MIGTLTETAPACVVARGEGLDQTLRQEMTLNDSPTASAAGSFLSDIVRLTAEARNLNDALTFGGN